MTLISKRLQKIRDRRREYEIWSSGYFTSEQEQQVDRDLRDAMLAMVTERFTHMLRRDYALRRRHRK